MWGIEFGKPQVAWLAPVAFVIALVTTSFALVLARRAASRFWRAGVVGPGTGSIALHALLLSLGLATLVLAAALPRWGYQVGTVVRHGRDIVLVVDVSRSMLAEDVVPSRLERARADLLDLVDVAGKRGGCRVGLVAFAGSGRSLSPLTESVSFVRRQIERLDPSLVARGGSYIEAGLREALSLFDGKAPNYSDIVLVSDGDDFGSKLEPIIRELKDKGITVHAIMRGDDTQGAEIPIQGASGTKGFLRYRGEIVRTVARADMLKRIAEATGGVFVPARTAPVDMERFFDVAIWHRPKLLRAEDRTQKPRERFIWFALPAFVLLLVQTVLSVLPQRREGNRPIAAGLLTAVLLAATGVVLLGGAAPEGEEQGNRSRAERLIRQAVRDYLSGNRDRARLLFQLACNEDPSWWLPQYQLGTLLMDARDWGEAAHRLLEARNVAPVAVHPLINYGAGTATFRQAEQAMLAGERDQAVRLLESAEALLDDALDQVSSRPDMVEGYLSTLLVQGEQSQISLKDFEMRIRRNLELVRRLLARLRREASRQSPPRPESAEPEERERAGSEKGKEDQSEGRRDSAQQEGQRRSEEETGDGEQQEQTSISRPPSSLESPSEQPMPQPQSRQDQTREQGEKLEPLTEADKPPSPVQGDEKDTELDAEIRLLAEVQRLQERDRARLKRQFHIYVPRADRDW